MTTKQVLIIEDDATMLRGLQDNFRAKGFEVVAATNGNAGLAAALADTADLIILDLMLPFINGYEICREVRGKRIQTPIIMLTAKGQEADIVRGLELGADDYVTKPFSIRELLARANGFIRRNTHSSIASPITSFGAYQLDRDAKVLSREGETVSLTTKEYRLLEFMVSSGGRALTRNEILSKVWGSQFAVTSRSVDRCVTTLRAKIEEQPSQPRHICTIRDVGYRFVAEP